MTPEQHRRSRTAWLVSAAITFALGVALRLWAPHLAPYIVGTETWVWPLVPAAYHHGWLRRPVEPVTDEGRP